MSRRRDQYSAFTLVELLVVIGIIAVLLSILLPTLGRARRAARSVQCLSNLRQLAMVELQYYTDNKYHFSPYYDYGGSPPNPFQIEWMQQVTKPQQLNKVRLCPEATDPNPGYMPSTPPTPGTPGPNMPGTAFNCWGPYGRAMQYFDDKGNYQHLAGSYGFNGYCLRAYSDVDTKTLKRPTSWSGDDTALEKSGQAGDLSRLWVPPLKRTAEVPVLYDSIWPTAWPKESDSVPSSLYAPAGWGSMNISNNMNRVCTARHRMAINVAFLDGHASTVELPDLWNLPWHRKWDATKVNFNTIRNTIKAEFKG